MEEKNRVLASSVVRSNSFMRHWTGLDMPTIWLEADEKPDNMWTICAIGTTEVSRNGGIKNLKNFFIGEKSLPALPAPQSLQQITNFSDNGRRISAYQSNIIAKDISFSDTLAHLVFFEELKNNACPELYDTTMLSFGILRELRSLRNSWGSSSHCKPGF